MIKEDKDYCLMLEKIEAGNGDITDWLVWFRFLDCLDRAITISETNLRYGITKALFWESHKEKELNKRQIIIVNTLFDTPSGKISTRSCEKVCQYSTKHFRKRR